jgi:hypothetical protein
MKRKYSTSSARNDVECALVREVIVFYDSRAKVEERMAKCKLGIARRSTVQLRSWGKKSCCKESVLHVRGPAYVGSLADNPL